MNPRLVVRFVACALVPPFVARADFTFSDSIPSLEWYASVQIPHACLNDGTGCENNWHFAIGCGTDCPLPFPGPTDNVLIPPGIFATLANGGSANVRSFDIQRPFTLDGSINVSQPSYFRSDLSWVNGTLSGTTPAAKFNLPANSSITISGSAGKNVAGCDLQLDVPCVWVGTGPIGLASGARIVNNVQFTAASDASLSFLGGPIGAFENNGVFNKSGGVGLTAINGMLFNNHGTVRVQSGTLRLANNGASDGPFQISENAVVETIGGNYNFNAGTSVTGTGILRVNGTLILNAPVSAEIVDVTSLLTGPGDLNITRNLLWSSGTMNGGAAINIPAGKAALLYGANPKTLDNRAFVNAGHTTWIDTGQISLVSGASFQNSGLLEIGGDAALQYVGGTGVTALNSGTMRKYQSNGTTTFSGVNFSNSGTINIETGTLRLSTSGTSTGPINLSAGTFLEFPGGNYTLDTGSDVTGAGTTRLNGVTRVNGGVTIEAAELSSLLLGPGTLTVPRSLLWTGGTASNGTLTLPAGATAELSTASTKSLDAFTLNNQTTLTWRDAGAINLVSNSTINNAGTFEARDDGTIQFVGGTACTFNNSGTFRKTTGAGTTTLSGMPFNNTGTVEVNSGTLRLANAGISSGPFNLGPNATLEFAGGNYRFATGASVSGGLARINGTLSLLNDATIENAELSSLIVGPGVATFSSALSWVGGTMSIVSVEIPSGATAELSTASTKSLDRTIFNNRGSTVWRDAGAVNLVSSSTINNFGTFEARDNGTIQFVGGTACVFNNPGIFRKTSGVGTTALSGMPFNNIGTVEVNTGTLRLANTGSATGTFDIASGAVLETIGGTYTFNSGAAVTGDGLFRINGALVAAGNAAARNVELTSLLTGSAAFTVNNSLIWNSGTMNSGGLTIVAAGAGATIATTNAKNIDARTLRNLGTITWQDAGAINLTGGATIDNRGVFDMKNDATMQFVGGAGSSLLNSGTIRKSGGSGVSNFSNFPTTNTGTIDVQLGRLAVSNLAQTAGQTHVASAATLQVTQPLALGGGTLTGGGAVFGNVSNTAGRVLPGEDVGTLAITGNYSQTGNAGLDITIAGTNPGNTYDQLIVSGAVALGGELRIAYAGGFTPTVGQQFTVLTAGSIGGTFATIIAPGQVSVAYNSGSVVVTVVAPPCLGDLNGDQAVNLTDLATLLANFGVGSGATPAMGDIDGDGDIDLTDLATLLARFGTSC